MKCIQFIHNGEIQRVPNNIAEKIVATKLAMYVFKLLWKSQVRDAK